MGGVVVEMLWCAAGCSVIMVVLLSVWIHGVIV